MKYTPGDIIEGVITGIKPYGAFVMVDSETVGLIHISELSTGFVKEISNFVKPGEKVQLKVIDVDQETGHLRLSLKALEMTRKNRQGKYKPDVKLPESKLGFSTIAKSLNQWIEEKMKEIKK